MDPKLGDGYVIHFTRTRSKETIFPSLSTISYKQDTPSPCRECGCQASIHRGVVKTCLDCFQQDGRKHRSLHRYEYGWSLLQFRLARRGTCTTLLDTKSPHQVVNEASNLHTDNAFGEYFATYCRTGSRASEQAAFVSDCERNIKEANEWARKFLRRN